MLECLNAKKNFLNPLKIKNWEGLITAVRRENDVKLSSHWSHQSCEKGPLDFESWALSTSDFNETLNRKKSILSHLQNKQCVNLLWNKADKNSTPIRGMWLVRLSHRSVWKSWRGVLDSYPSQCPCVSVALDMSKEILQCHSSAYLGHYQPLSTFLDPNNDLLNMPRSLISLHIDNSLSTTAM